MSIEKRVNPFIPATAAVNRNSKPKEEEKPKEPIPIKTYSMRRGYRINSQGNPVLDKKY